MNKSFLVLFFKKELLLLFFLVFAFPAAGERAPVDWPELAAPGAYTAGVATLEIARPSRRLALRVWYPASGGGARVTYKAALAGPDGKFVSFSVPGRAVADAAPAPGKFPLVLLAHGYGNDAEVMAWLGENLASKGYVVAAPTFGDPALFDAAGLGEVIARRPADIAFLAAETRRRALAGQAPFAHADPERLALIGYSMGGYGVLTAAGAALDPGLAAATHGALAPFVAGGARAGDIRLANVKAVVAISPPLHLGPLTMWNAAGLAAIRVPTFILGGSQDHVVGYEGIRTIFETETNAPRYLLTFREAGHGIGLCAAPPEMQGSLWDQDWFEDPVWRKLRLIGIESHFMTAFLDRYVKGEAVKAGYIDGLVANSDDGNAGAGRSWKGFAAGHQAGMSLEFRPAK